MAAKVMLPPPAAGLVRERLHAALGALGDHRMGLVVAPAGSGKTTLLRQFAAATSVPVAWYQAEPSDRSVADLLRHLQAAFEAAVGPLEGDWSTIEGAVTSLERRSADRLVLVVDDLHHLEATPAEAALERLVTYAPAGMALLAASRYPPGFNLPRLRVCGSLIELDPDDLRFRAWEVERLFRDHYGTRLAPEELARLAHRTEGWAAGLQLFHLATAGKPAAERRRVIDAMAGRSRPVREYLTRNVLDELSSELRDFLVDTSVLGRLSGVLCDQLLDRDGSARLLAEMERRCLFTSSVDASTFRYHEVLRGLLDEMLVERRGEAGARAAHGRAAVLLEEHGYLPEALRSYCRAEDWEAAGRLLGRRGEQVVASSGPWVEGLPAALAERDPWLLLGTARRHVLGGRLDEALVAYRRAEASFPVESAAESCRRERVAVAGWVAPASVHADDWSSLLRRATRRQPMEASRAAKAIGGPGGRLVEGVASLLAGHLTQAGAVFSAIDADDGPLIAAGARLGMAVASALAGGSGDPAELRAALDTLESNGLVWLARLGRAVVSAPAEVGSELDEMAASAAADANPWGSALARLLQGILDLASGGRPVEVLGEALTELRRLHAGVLESWAEAGLALAMVRGEEPGALDAARRAQAKARSAGCDGAALLAGVALAKSDPTRAQMHLAAVRAVADETGIDPARFEGPTAVIEDRREPAPPAAPSKTANSVTLRCFGGFSLALAGREVDCSLVKPRARSVLHLLAAHAGRPVHREVMVDALWPELGLQAGLRNLQVAISSLRQLLEPGVERGASSLLVRQGEAYRLRLPDDADADLVAFERSLAEGRQRRGAGDLEVAEAAFDGALLAYSGDLLPEEGAGEWLVKLRDHFRMEAVAGAHALAELRLARGDASGAVTAAEAGLKVDHYRDGLWRLLVAAHRRAGERAAQASAERRYGQALAELGIEPG